MTGERNDCGPESSQTLRKALQLCVDMIVANGLAEGLANTLETARRALASQPLPMGAGEPTDGGPSFPSPEIRGPDGTGFCAPEYGMSLRAYFAGQALVGLLSQPGMTIDIDGERLGEKRAGVCVAMADALIAELEKQ